jgi:hypothetical protein
VAEPRAVATGKCSSSGVRLSFGKVAREKRRDRKKLFAANVCSQGPSENWPGRTASDFSSQAGALRLADISQVRPPLFNPFLPRFGFNPVQAASGGLTATATATSGQATNQQGQRAGQQQQQKQCEQLLIDVKAILSNLYYKKYFLFFIAYTLFYSISFLNFSHSSYSILRYIILM